MCTQIRPGWTLPTPRLRSFGAARNQRTASRTNRFIATRRALRPASEYREPTQQEWADFDSHFARRKIALGDCRRPYGSDCVHEHACLRCQFLQVDVHRGGGQLDELEHNLQERLAEAEANAWLGDVEQLRLTLTHLHRKRVELTELLATLPTSLLTPVSADPGPRTPQL